MCPVPRTNDADPNGNPEAATNQVHERIIVNLDEYYNDYEETSPYRLSQVTVDWSMKLNRNLAANCRNISDEVFPGIHLGDR